MSGTLAEVEEGEGRAMDTEDGDATGLGKVRWKVQVVGRRCGRRKEGGRTCLQILYRALQPPRSAVSPFTGAAAPAFTATATTSVRPWSARGRMVWGRAAGGARQIRELHCQAGMIYLTNISI